MQETLGLTPDSGRSPGGGHGNPLHYSCLENLHGQRRLVAIFHGVTESDTTEQLSTAQHIYIHTDMYVYINIYIHTYLNVYV